MKVSRSKKKKQTNRRHRAAIEATQKGYLAIRQCVKPRICRTSDVSRVKSATCPLSICRWEVRRYSTGESIFFIVCGVRARARARAREDPDRHRIRRMIRQTDRPCAINAPRLTMMISYSITVQIYFSRLSDLQRSRDRNNRPF